MLRRSSRREVTAHANTSTRNTANVVSVIATPPGLYRVAFLTARWGSNSMSALSHAQPLRVTAPEPDMPLVDCSAMAGVPSVTGSSTPTHLRSVRFGGVDSPVDRGGDGWLTGAAD